MFCRGDLGSVSAQLEGFNTFSSISGLVLNNSKSLCFMSNVRDDIAISFIALTGFQRGNLPICYLGCL